MNSEPPNQNGPSDEELLAELESNLDITFIPKSIVAMRDRVRIFVDSRIDGVRVDSVDILDGHNNYPTVVGVAIAGVSANARLKAYLSSKNGSTGVVRWLSASFTT